MADNEKNSNLLAKLYDSGYIDEAGVPIIKKDDPDEM